MSMFFPENHPLYKKYANQYEQEHINGINSPYEGDFYSWRDRDDYYNDKYSKSMKELPNKVIDELINAQNSEKFVESYPTFDNIIEQDVTKEQLLDNLFDYVDDNEIDYDFYKQQEQNPYADELLHPKTIKDMNKILYKQQILKMLESK